MVGVAQAEAVRKDARARRLAYRWLLREWVNAVSLLYTGVHNQRALTNKSLSIQSAANRLASTQPSYDFLSGGAAQKPTPSLRQSARRPSIVEPGMCLNSHWRHLLTSRSRSRKRRHTSKTENIAIWDWCFQTRKGDYEDKAWERVTRCSSESWSRFQEGTGNFTRSRACADVSSFPAFRLPRAASTLRAANLKP